MEPTTDAEVKTETSFQKCKENIRTFWLFKIK